MSVTYLQPYAKYGFTEDQVMSFLETYALTGSVEKSAHAIGIPSKEGYKLVLLKDFQDQLRTFNALDNQKLDVTLTLAMNKALKKSLEIIERGTDTVMTKAGPMEIDIPLKDIVNALDKVFRARQLLRGAGGTGISEKEAAELSKLKDKMKKHAESVIPVKGERIDDSERDS